MTKDSISNKTENRQIVYNADKGTIINKAGPGYMGDENKIPGLEMQMRSGQPTHVKIFSQFVSLEGRDFSPNMYSLKH